MVQHRQGDPSIHAAISVEHNYLPCTLNHMAVKDPNVAVGRF